MFNLNIHNLYTEDLTSNKSNKNYKPQQQFNLSPYTQQPSKPIEDKIILKTKPICKFIKQKKFPLTINFNSLNFKK